MCPFADGNEWITIDLDVKSVNMKLSVVVPIYNVEPYLSKCVDSLLAQDMSADEYEIILVDDGSTDVSGTIADEYAERYANICVIHQPNGGLSAARNTGIDAAEGKYIQFVDSDDFLEPNVLGGLVKKMEQDNLDVLRFNYQNINERYEVFEPYKDMKPFVDYRDEICDGLTFLTERLGYACYAWQFMIKTKLLKPQEHQFKCGIYFEDTEWTPRLLVRARRVTSVGTMAYNYLMRVGSITQAVTEEKKRKVLADKLSLVDSLNRQAESCSDKCWFEGMIAGTTLSILSLVTADFYKERGNIIRQLRRKRVFPLSCYHATERTARKLKLINVSPELFCLLHHWKNK